MSNVTVTRESEGLATLTSSGLTIDKLARNITKKSNTWTNVLYVNPGDEIEFLIRIKSTNKEVNSVSIKDNLPSKMFYISDSTTIDGNYHSDGITTKNVYLSSVYPNLTGEIKFRAKIVPESEFNFYPISLVNEALAWGNDGKEIKDSVKIIVNQPSQSSVKGVSIVSGRSISLIKSGRNITKNQLNFADSFFADPKDELEFLIQIINNGSMDVNNVKIWDNLPSSISIIEGSTIIDGIYWGGDVTGSGLNIGTIKSGDSRIIKFKARVVSADKFKVGSTTLVNTAFVSANNLSRLFGQVSIIVRVSEGVLGAAIVKTGFDYLKFLFIFAISGVLTIIFYCRLREKRLLEALNSGKTGKFRKLIIGLYFKTKLMLVIGLMKFRKKLF